jgi:hypothetical protein
MNHICSLWCLESKSSHPVVALDGPELCAWSLLLQGFLCCSSFYESFWRVFPRKSSQSADLFLWFIGDLEDMWQWYWHVLYLQCFAIITSGSAFLVIGYLLMEDYCAGDLFCYILIFPCSRGLLLHSMVHCFAMSRLERESVVFLSLWPWCLLLSFFLTVWFENMLFSSCPASSRYCQLCWDPWLLLVWKPSRYPL